MTFLSYLRNPKTRTRVVRVVQVSKKFHKKHQNMHAQLQLPVLSATLHMAQTDPYTIKTSRAHCHGVTYSSLHNETTLVH